MYVDRNRKKNLNKRLSPCFLWVTGAAVISAFSASTVQDALLILSPNGDLFETARIGLVQELEDEFAISIQEVNKATRATDIEKAFIASTPRAVVLIGNSSIRLYTKYAHNHREKTVSVPVVAILALDIKRAVYGLENVGGIAYETPMVTALVNFRRVINQPVESVGVIYRKAFQEFITKHAMYCKREKITVKSIMISDDTSSHKKEISRALKQLVKKERVQVFWVPNDNILLKPKLLVKVWLPLFTGHKVPVVVGVESLVKPELNFGTYAVIPDPKALGEQAADLITDLKDDEWNFHQIVIYPAISMYSVLNMKKATLIKDVKSINVDEVNKVFMEGKK